jgi:ParB family chromosome partitioning protein
MGKLDDLRRKAVGNIDESMGAGRPAPGAMHGVSAPASAVRAVPARLQGLVRSQNAAEIPVAKIIPDPDQPREEFDEAGLERLADSLRTRGQLQPVRVRWDEASGVYVLVCGERRWRAANLAGLTTLSCVIHDGPVEAGELLALQLIENCVREDLRPVEQARAFRTLMDSNGWSGNQLAKALGIPQPSVVRALALLELPAPVQEKVEQGALAPATAYEISKVADSAHQQALAELVVEGGMTRSETIEAVRRAAPRAAKGGAAKPKKPTVRVVRTSAAKVTVEFRKAVSDAEVVAALREALARLEAEAGESQAAA